MSEINVVEEVQRRVRNQVARLTRELLDAGVHPASVEAITVEEKSDGVVVTVGKVTAAQKRAYDKAESAEESVSFRLDESRLDEGAVLGEESGLTLDFGSGPDAEFDEDALSGTEE